jgi:ribosome biogenesis GTPase
MASLAELGWTDEWARAFEPVAGPAVAPGRVVLEHNHVYRVLTADGERLAETAGRLKHRAAGRHELPVVGDWVAVGQDDSGARVQIRAVLPRRTSFSRKAAGRETEEQVVAANIDVVFMVFGLDGPANPNSIDRYLVVARKSGATPVVVLNKADLCTSLEAEVDVAAAAAGRVPVLAVSTKAAPGVVPLEAHLAFGRTAALIGPSGAGKSSLINALIGLEVLATGAVRDWDARGRHTSVHRQLVVRPGGGVFIDTPGMRELALWDTDAVTDTFEDLQALADGCRFRDCRHEREPGCAVKAAVEAGEVEASRVESYAKLRVEQDLVERKRSERALIDAKRQQGRAGAKAMREFHRDRDRRDP